MSKRLLVNIRGCNGAGKSTIPMSMMDDPEMKVISKTYNGKSKNILTVFPTYGWVALGTYFIKTGGLDGFPDKNLTRKSLIYAIEHFPEYNILMEGVISSTIFSTYLELFKNIEEKYNIKVAIINFLPPFEVCLERIYQRNGGKPIKEEGVLSKWNTVNRNADKFKAQGLLSIKVDNSHTSKENMLKKFNQMIDRIQKEV